MSTNTDRVTPRARERARDLLQAFDTGRQILSAIDTGDAPAIADAYRVTAALRQMRRERGEHPIGRKIGFTNRNIWAQYGVDAPIWGDMYDTTVIELASIDGRFALEETLEPRIEPEIVLGLATAPEPGMDETALLECVGFVAHGFEIVRSIYPNWRFTGSESVQGFGLHGTLLLGARVPVTSTDRARWLGDLATFQITLERGEVEIDTGTGSNVLGGPLSALRHLNDLLDRDPVNPPLMAGEIVTTGTLTAACPAAREEHWRTRLDGIALEGLEVCFV